MEVLCSFCNKAPHDFLRKHELDKEQGHWSCDLWAGQSVLCNLSRTTNTHRSGVSKVLLRGGWGVRKLGVG